MTEETLYFELKKKLSKLFSNTTFRIFIGFLIYFFIIILLFSLTEHISIYDSIYWGITTSATVGYGDISPKTNFGKFLAISLMIGGVALLGYLLTTFSNSLVSINLNKVMGLGRSKKKGHTIILGWNGVARHALEELVEKNCEVVVVDSESRLEVNEYPNTQFIIGDINDKITLIRAGVLNAKNIILTMYDDSEVILALSGIKRLNPHIKVIGRVDDHDLIDVAKSAGCNESVSPSLISGKLLRSSLEEPAITKWVHEVVTSSYGGDLIEIPLVDHSAWQNRRVGSLKIKNCLIIAVCNTNSSEIESIPNPDRILNKEDSLIVIDYNKKRIKDNVVRHLNDDAKRGPVLICGWNRTLMAAVDDMYNSRKITILAEGVDKSDIDRYSKKGVKFIEGKIDKFNLITKVDISKVKNVIVGMRNDSEVILVTYIIRSLNKDVNLIARVDDKANDESAYAAGANHVVSPSEIGGRLLVKSLYAPNAVRLLSEAITINDGVDLKVWSMKEHKEYIGVRIKDLKLPKNVMVICLDKESDSTLSDLDDDYILKKEDSIIVLKK
jgi:voltage-gated potassium channel